MDSLKCCERYFCINEDLRTALEYLRRTDFSKVQDGNYEIRGKDIYAVVGRYSSKPRGKSLWESHRKFTDVHYVASGIEKIGSAPAERLTIAEEYNEEKDIVTLKGDGDFLMLKEGTFAVFHPGECHMPGIALDSPREVVKVVVKVRVP